MNQLFSSKEASPVPYKIKDMIESWENLVVALPPISRKDFRVSQWAVVLDDDDDDDDDEFWGAVRTAPRCVTWVSHIKIHC